MEKIVPKRKKTTLTKKQSNVIHLEDYKRKISEIKQKGQEEYHPKYGRQIVQIKKQINKIA